MAIEIVVVDVGLGNLRSVEKSVLRAASELKHEVHVVRSGELGVIRRADRIIVPGQGGFRDCARAFDAGLRELLVERLRAGTPYFGICLGLQVLFDDSEEAPGATGLGWFHGSVKRLQGGDGIKIPHMGWNQLELCGATPHRYLEAAGGAGSWFYFVHSYHAVPNDESVLAAQVEYGSNRITAAVEREHVFATQFHPEKSQRAGLALLRSFLEV